MLIAIFIISALLATAIILVYLQLKSLEDDLSALYTEIGDLYGKIRQLESEPVTLAVNDVPVAWDKKSETVLIKGNLAATGTIASAGKKV